MTEEKWGRRRRGGENPRKRAEITERGMKDLEDKSRKTPAHSIQNTSHHVEKNQDTQLAGAYPKLGRARPCSWEWTPATRLPHPSRDPLPPLSENLPWKLYGKISGNETSARWGPVAWDTVAGRGAEHRYSLLRGAWYCNVSVKATLGGLHVTWHRVEDSYWCSLSSFRPQAIPSPRRESLEAEEIS